MTAARRARRTKIPCFRFSGKTCFFEKKPQKTSARLQARQWAWVLAVLAPGMARAQTALSVSDVQGVINRVVAAAQARGVGATIAVVDRSGSVLAIWQMPTALGDVSILNNPGGANQAYPYGLNGLSIPATLTVIAKAITGAYLSSSNGNAFSTRTASQIIQDHFNPGTIDASAGPLYGVQFSQLPCSDIMVQGIPPGPPAPVYGPHSSPIGLAGDPGGFPLYKNGVLVGGIGVKASAVYGLDLNIHVNDNSLDEALAQAGAAGLQPPAGILASTITVAGLTLRYADVPLSAARLPPGEAPPPSSVPGTLISVGHYYNASNGILAGSAYGTPASGMVQDTSGTYSQTDQPYLLTGDCVSAPCTPRYPAIAGIGTAALTQAEVTQILRSTYAVALQTRAQIRNPPGSAAAVSITVNDAFGRVLGIISAPDAPIFGIDVALQKGRTAAFLSGAYGDQMLNATSGTASFSANATSFFHRPVFSGAYAWSARATGNIARDTYPDGINGTPHGPLSLAADQTNPFSDGLQENLIAPDILWLGLALFYPQQFPDLPNSCTMLPSANAPGNDPPTLPPVLANGLQVFPGGFPIYRGTTLVGGIGVSGDGVDQDDFISFLGLYNAGQVLHSGIGHAPAAMRASTLTANGIAPRYVNCPYAPFLNGGGSNICNGK